MICPLFDGLPNENIDTLINSFDFNNNCLLYTNSLIIIIKLLPCGLCYASQSYPVPSQLQRLPSPFIPSFTKVTPNRIQEPTSWSVPGERGPNVLEKKTIFGKRFFFIRYSKLSRFSSYFSRCYPVF